MDLRSTLDLVACRAVTLDINEVMDLRDTLEGGLVVDAPRGALDDELLAALRHHRDLLVWSVIGRRSGHVVGYCTTCGEPSMVSTARRTWPGCRLTLGCQGRHVPARIES